MTDQEILTPEKKAQKLLSTHTETHLLPAEIDLYKDKEPQVFATDLMYNIPVEDLGGFAHFGAIINIKGEIVQTDTAATFAVKVLGFIEEGQEDAEVHYRYTVKHQVISENGSSKRKITIIKSGGDIQGEDEVIIHINEDLEITMLELKGNGYGPHIDAIARDLGIKETLNNGMGHEQPGTGRKLPEDNEPYLTGILADDFKKITFAAEIALQRDIQLASHGLNMNETIDNRRN